MATTLRRLDGTETTLESECGQREGCTTAHGLRTTAGHIVRQTMLAGGAQRDCAEYSATQYGEALKHAKRIRSAGDGTYAVIDWRYTCGCRGMA